MANDGVGQFKGNCTGLPHITGKAVHMNLLPPGQQLLQRTLHPGYCPGLSAPTDGFGNRRGTVAAFQTYRTAKAGIGINDNAQTEHKRNFTKRLKTLKTQHAQPFLGLLVINAIIVEFPAHGVMLAQEVETCGKIGFTGLRPSRQLT